MKLIEAYIPAEAVYEIQDLLVENGIEDVVASEVAVEVTGDHSKSDVTNFVPQVKLEMVVADEQAPHHRSADLQGGCQKAGKATYSGPHWTA